MSVNYEQQANSGLQQLGLTVAALGVHLNER